MEMKPCISRKICEQCSNDCKIFIRGNEYYVLCAPCEIVKRCDDSSTDFDDAQHSFNYFYFKSEVYVYHVGREKKKRRRLYGCENDDEPLFLYGKCRIGKYSYRPEYKYEGWNPFKRIAAYLSKKKADAFWERLKNCTHSQIKYSVKFDCPYEMEHIMSELSSEGGK